MQITNTLLPEIFSHTALGIGVTALTWFLLFPLRSIIKTVKQKADILDSLHVELAQQRTNCLTTLQAQGTKQVELLEKMAGTLDKTNDAQIETNTILRGLQSRF